MIQKLRSKYQALYSLTALLSAVVFVLFLYIHSCQLHIHKTSSGQIVVHAHAHADNAGNPETRAHTHTKIEYLQLFILGIIGFFVYYIIKLNQVTSIRTQLYRTISPIPEDAGKLIYTLRSPPPFI
ncbi:MAG: hypothetical protein JXQ65_14025 [Candidatus Marinimicrobia bacterium]|nr:hypothetical protein [Candidatus Neomarinimicrobiota bacterium]